jgi:DNA-binding response OmpR family regulator
MVLNADGGHHNSTRTNCRDGDQNIRPLRILFVEDDPDLMHAVTDYLDGKDMHVIPASNRLDALRRLVECVPDVVILDFEICSEDGFGLLREARKRSNTSAIIVSGHCCEELDRVKGLDLGADDCIAKPFGLRELRARIRAILRRRKHAANGALPFKRARRFRFGGWQLDRHTRRLTNPARTLVKLTNNDFAILLAFLEAPQRPLTREYLLQASRVHGDVFDRSIDVQVLRLRRKLERVPTSPRVILTERGIGYTFALRVEQEAN